MPWKGEKDPYKIWLSEIILQQTRVEQGRAYYERFIAHYPDIKSLATARDEEVFKLWEGLGYYTRCKNLLLTARYILQHYDGQFPRTFEAIVALKGIGDYTASAIASFCFNLPHAVVDGNVFRVLSRVFNDPTPIDTPQGKKKFTALAGQLLDRTAPGLYNQAIMDFGATVCKPALPLCARCPLIAGCAAHRQGLVGALPVKEKSLTKKRRWLSYFIIEAQGDIFIRKRTAKDIWQNLHEFYLVETPHDPLWTEDTVLEMLQSQLDTPHAVVTSIFRAKHQQLTHQRIDGYFIGVVLDNIPALLKGNESVWVEKGALERYAFPGYINQNWIFKKNMPILF